MLGARILLRSALETIAVLIYLNQLTRKVLSGELSFHDFSERTSTLLLGSRDGSTPRPAMSILTVLEKAEARYPGVTSIYARLSESAHPNYEAMAVGYSDLDADGAVVTFRNKWQAMYGATHMDSVTACIKVFFAEYNEEWPDAFERLEAWIEANDAELESTKRGA